MLHYCLDLTGKIVHTWYIKCYWKRKTTRKFIFISFIFFQLSLKLQDQQLLIYVKQKKTSLRSCYGVILVLHRNRQHFRSGTRKALPYDGCVCVSVHVCCGIKLAHLQVEFRVKLSLSHTHGSPAPNLPPRRAIWLPG